MHNQRSACIHNLNISPSTICEVLLLSIKLDEDIEPAQKFLPASSYIPKGGTVLQSLISALAKCLDKREQFYLKNHSCLNPRNRHRDGHYSYWRFSMNQMWRYK